jgi:hypothetical protein
MKLASDNTSPINNSTSTIDNQIDDRRRTHSTRTSLTEIVS